MFKRLGQILAVVAVMASAVNAQCDLSCSLQAMTRPAAPEAGSIKATHAGHPCCPAQQVPQPSDQHRHQQPCPDPLPVVSDLTVATNLHVDSPPQWADLTAGHSFNLVLPIQQSSLPLVVESPPAPDISAFSILRI
jgi:hypothetical protein